jgi:Glycosyl hydrolase family 59
VYGLSWTWPAWTGGGGNEGSPWNTPQLAANYTLQWLECARSAWGVEVDYVGIWNERSWSDEYIVELRQVLDAGGFGRTAIVAPDGSWDVANDMLANATVNASVDVLGAHYPGMVTTPQAQATGRPLVSSEDGAWLRGGSTGARERGRAAARRRGRGAEGGGICGCGVVWCGSSAPYLVQATPSAMALGRLVLRGS